MKTYQYKMQWLLPIVTPKGFKVFRTFINYIGARSLDKITLRDKEYNILDQYDGFISYACRDANKDLISYVKRQLESQTDIVYVELLRK